MVQVLAAAGAALGAFLLMVLLAKRPSHPADKWLAAWLGAVAVFCAALLGAGALPPTLALPTLGVGQMAVLALGPAQYLYAATAFGRPPRYAVHLVVASAGAALMLAMPLLGEVRAAGGAIEVDASPWMIALPPTVMAALAAYPAAVLRMTAERKRRLMDEVANLAAVDPGWVRLWSWTWLTVLASLALVFLTSAFGEWPRELHMVVTLAVLVAHVGFVGQRGLTRRGVFFAPPAPAAPTAAGRERPTDLAGARQDYARVQDLLQREKPHLDPDLTAQTLADRLGWGGERLTGALRHGGASTFFDTVNAARVEEVQALARQPANAGVTLLALAYEAGFGSKSAFYEAFQRHAGCTPAAWRRRLSD
ncbi:MAG TPA: AraC family transcriptional regulator [Caulobacteraceae bacterium]|jgi:AraC-like DNA-binding protein